MISINFDETNLPTAAVLRVTAQYFEQLAQAQGAPALVHAPVANRTHGERQVTVKLNLDTSAASENLAKLAEQSRLMQVAPGEFIRDDENAPVGTDADRPNVEGFGRAPVTAAVVQPSTAPDTSTVPSVPTPPAPPSVPEVPAPPAPATPSSHAEIDSNGVVWDERIHASSKAKVADGSWRMKRGVDPALVKQVEAELLASTGGAASTSIELVSGTWDDPIDVPAPPVPAATPADPTAIKTFAEFCMWVAALTRNKEITQTEILETLRTVGVGTIPALAPQPALIPVAVAAIQEVLGYGEPK